VSQPNQRISLWQLSGLVLILVATAWWRGHTFAPTLERLWGVAPWPVVRGEAEPLDCDEAAYAYMGRKQLAGSVLYRDLSENKPPLGYWIYAAGVALDPVDVETSVRLLALPFVLGTVSILWLVGLRLAGAWAGALAALAYGLTSTDPYVYGNGTQLGLFLNFFTTACLASLLAGLRSGRLVWFLAAGLTLGLSSLVRQVTPLYLLAIVPALWFHRTITTLQDSEPNKSPSPVWKTLCVLLAGFLLPWLVAVLILAAQGALHAAKEEVIDHALALARDIPPDPNAPSPWIRWLTGNADPKGQLPPPFGTTNYLVWWGTGSWPFQISSAAALLALLFVARIPYGRLIACWLLLSWAQVLAPGQYWPHYYLGPLPGASLAVALVVSAGLFGKPIPIQSRWLGRSTAALLLVGLALTLAIQTRDYLLVPAEELTARYKGGRQWIQLRKTGRSLAELARDLDKPRIHVWGWQSPLYVYARMDSPSPYFFVNNLLRDFSTKPHPLITPRIEALQASLTANPPELLFVGYEPFPGLRALIDSRYTPLGQVTPDGRGLWIESSALARLGPRSSSAP
jgi:4-amino-4-deoxy-L-arabinose transferase-like glycosyltransferase